MTTHMHKCVIKSLPTISNPWALMHAYLQYLKVPVSVCLVLLFRQAGPTKVYLHY